MKHVKVAGLLIDLFSHGHDPMFSIVGGLSQHHTPICCPMPFWHLRRAAWWNTQESCQWAVSTHLVAILLKEQPAASPANILFGEELPKLDVLRFPHRKGSMQESKSKNNLPQAEGSIFPNGLISSNADLWSPGCLLDSYFVAYPT